MDIVYVFSSLKSPIADKLNQVLGKKEAFGGSSVLGAVFGLLWLICVVLAGLGLWIRMVVIASRCSAMEGVFAFFLTSFYCFFKLGSLIDLSCKQSIVTQM